MILLILHISNLQALKCVKYRKNVFLFHKFICILFIYTTLSARLIFLKYSHLMTEVHIFLPNDSPCLLLIFAKWFAISSLILKNNTK